MCTQSSTVVEAKILLDPQVARAAAAACVTPAHLGASAHRR
ncbi:hypothetical protein ACFWZT_36485 [Streptomyces alboflavus]